MPPAEASLIRRFGPTERALHWVHAAGFLAMLATGLVLYLPVLSEIVARRNLVKNLHLLAAVAWVLAVGLVLVVGDRARLWADWREIESIDADDRRWLRGRRAPQGRFNAGQKGIFWITVLGGAAVAVTGYMLVFPFFFTDIAGMQLSHMVHSIVAVLMIAVMLAHIYIGTVGMEGAIDAMSTGQVDLNWAKQHHNLWVEQEVAKGRAASPPAGARPAGAD